MTRSDLRENILMAVDTLWENKLRSFLTILGVVVGTMTVIVIAAFVSGIDTQVSKEIESFGTNSIYIFKFNPGFNFNLSAEERMRKPISAEDAIAIGNECPSVINVAAFMSPVDFLQYPATHAWHATCRARWPNASRSDIRIPKW
jgi:putative ABC transport system permease protein